MVGVMRRYRVVLVVLIIFSCGCSAEQFKHRFASMAYETGQNYACDTQLERDREQHKERCDPVALGGKRITYEEYRDRRSAELEPES